MEAWTTGTLFLPVSPTCEDVFWRFTANIFALFDRSVLTAWGDVFADFLQTAWSVGLYRLDSFSVFSDRAGLPPR